MLGDYEYRYEEGAPGAPTLLLLHGTGGDENDLLPLGAMLLPGANRLSPRGNVAENGMARFFRRLAEGVFDEEDLRRRTDQLAGFVALAAERHAFDASRVIAVGYSNGANIAASLLLRRPQALRAAVLLHAMVPFEPDAPPDLAGKAVFLSAGRNDPIVPSENAARLAEILRSAGADVTLSWQNAGHSLTREEAASARSWLDARLDAFQAG
ncbi:MAG TPA: alpha/beta hydrolase [Chthonomonadaceae bacterium]|nr:alpha/beta hydrolase [Chthonomonadaceae bacterium]